MRPHSLVLLDLAYASRREAPSTRVGACAHLSAFCSRPSDPPPRGQAAPSHSTSIEHALWSPPPPGCNDKAVSYSSFCKFDTLLRAFLFLLVNKESVFCLLLLFLGDFCPQVE